MEVAAQKIGSVKTSLLPLIHWEQRGNEVKEVKSRIILTRLRITESVEPEQLCAVVV